MKDLKFILFIWIISMFVVVCVHIGAIIQKAEFPKHMYITITVFVIIVCFLVIYIFAPLWLWLMQ